jgi:hypothetical protein
VAAFASGTCAVTRASWDRRLSWLTWFEEETEAMWLWSFSWEARFEEASEDVTDVMISLTRLATPGSNPGDGRVGDRSGVGGAGGGMWSAAMMPKYRKPSGVRE